MINNRQDVLDNLPAIFTEIEEVNQKWHINPDGTRKARDPDFYPRCILLMGSELSEAFEAIRKGNQPDSHLPQYPGESVELVDLFIRAIDIIVFHPESDVLKAALDEILTDDNKDNLAYFSQIDVYAGLDRAIYLIYENATNVVAVIDLVVSYCDYHRIPLMEIYRAKTDYNRNRADHKLEARQAEGGKKF